MYMNVYPSDNKLSQYTYTTTKPGDIFSLPPTTPPTINNEPTLTSTTTKTTTTTTTTSDNQNHPKQSAIETDNDNASDAGDSQPIRKVKLSANESKVVEEAPCVRRQYYQLGSEGENPETPESSGTPGKA
ncbi:laminin subunit alpha-like [Drosophila ficusphila]|uniref:laminin subunit alpha-like n=1 Tax=Drosophila ficusphila TaxID=30025 RepID=UPI001C88F2F5|nr:laminin subunit alpha-like [Drosophila ficusphila]